MWRPAAGVPCRIVQISNRSRIRFGEFATDYSVLRQIHNVFQSEDFEHAEPWDSFDTGQRRSLVAAYHANVDFSDPIDVTRLARVYADAINTWGRATPTGDLAPAALQVIRALQLDGVPISDDGRLSIAAAPSGLVIADLRLLAHPRVLEQQLERMSANVNADPPATIAAAKELVESVCKFVLEDYAVAYTTADDLPALYKKTAMVLRLNREAVPASAKGSGAAQRVLQNLTTAVQSLAELRNELGLGHGKTQPTPALSRHARLSLNASRTVAEFLLETWHARRDEDAAANT